MQVHVIQPNQVRDISGQLLDDQGLVRVVPSSVYEATSVQERLLFGVRNALYSFPTTELCDHLRSLIAGRSAIEIGSGHGGLAAALGIPATDNRQQEEPEIKAIYAQMGQPTVRYGANVEKLDALAAVAKYKPQVVIGCWVTHRYDPNRHELGGNESGVDEAALIASCDEYIFVGNERVHANKPIWSLPHEKIHPPFVYSRAGNGSKDFIAIWKR